MAAYAAHFSAVIPQALAISMVPVSRNRYQGAPSEVSRGLDTTSCVLGAVNFDASNPGSSSSANNSDLGKVVSEFHSFVSGRTRVEGCMKEKIIADPRTGEHRSSLSIDVGAHGPSRIVPAVLVESSDCHSSQGSIEHSFIDQTIQIVFIEQSRNL